MGTVASIRVRWRAPSTVSSRLIPGNYAVSIFLLAPANLAVNFCSIDFGLIAGSFGSSLELRPEKCRQSPKSCIFLRKLARIVPISPGPTIPPSDVQRNQRPLRRMVDLGRNRRSRTEPCISTCLQEDADMTMPARGRHCTESATPTGISRWRKPPASRNR